MPRILALGSSLQAIYDFRGADSRFLEKAEMVAPCFRPGLEISCEFRLTRPTAGFINNACLGGEQYILGMDVTAHAVGSSCQFVGHQGSL
jgi:hypothetical protein